MLFKSSIFCLFLALNCFSQQLTEEKLSKAVQIIWIIEGQNIRKPFGIENFPLKGKTAEQRKEYARKICYNTVFLNFKRWELAGKPGLFVDFLGNRYCPASVSKVGNKNWKKNFKYYQRKEHLIIE